MNIRTKVLSTIVAMICSISVSATGIVAIMLDFPVSVSNTSTISAASVNGDLYGERYGAADNDLMVKHLFKAGEDKPTDDMEEFTEDVNFSAGSRQITYVFKFILASDAESGVFASLTQAFLTDQTGYSHSYQYAYGKEEPQWNNAPEMVVGKTYVVDQSNPYIWLRATLKRNDGGYQRIDGGATWSFNFNFQGVAENS